MNPTQQKPQPFEVKSHDDFITLWESVSRSPFGFDFGYQAQDEVGLPQTLFFTSERELLEHLVVLEATNGSGPPIDDDLEPFLEARDDLTATCKKCNWQHSPTLLEALNEQFTGQHKIRWLGSFSEEFAEGEDGYFADLTFEILEEHGQAGLRDITHLADETKEAIVNALASS